jgi:hypothetical protein
MLLGRLADARFGSVESALHMVAKGRAGCAPSHQVQAAQARPFGRSVSASAFIRRNDARVKIRSRSLLSGTCGLPCSAMHDKEEPRLGRISKTMALLFHAHVPDQVRIEEQEDAMAAAALA